MIKVALVRGKYLNNFEGQNYLFNAKKVSLTAISSKYPLNNQFPFPVIKLLSVADLQNISLLNKPIKFLMNRLIGDAQFLFGLEKYADCFDIFHTADSHYYYSYQLAKLRKKGKIKQLVSTSWETIPFNNESVRQKKIIKKFTQKYVDLFICYTEKASQCLIAEGINEKKIQVIKLGVDLQRFKTKISNHKSTNILFVGRRVEEKGIDDLKEVVKGLNANLNIVEFGSVDYQKMPSVYQKADILVLPSKKTKTWEEQYGMVLVEAMASALPVVAYDTGAIREIVGEAGILVEESRTKLHQALKNLCDDRDLRLKLGKIGSERAEKFFDAKKTAHKLEKIYENFCRNSG